MALVDIRDDGVAIYNRTVTGRTVYLYSCIDNLKSEYSKEEKDNHIKIFTHYNFHNQTKGV